MKKLSILILVVFILSILLPTQIAYAHPGRLDSNGGHHDRSNGTYHYHDGYHSSGNNSNSSTFQDKTISNVGFLILIILILGAIVSFCLYKRDIKNSGIAFAIFAIFLCLIMKKCFYNTKFEFIISIIILIIVCVVVFVIIDSYM